jgi:hypothetical protein
VSPQSDIGHDGPDEAKGENNPFDGCPGLHELLRFASRRAITPTFEPTIPTQMSYIATPSGRLKVYDGKTRSEAELGPL